ncbi:hypothetical protein C0991_000739 [Blastosporella zonata]|nr:hypothetical protein C0991_000739 [Blastosporella zonata]
MESPSLSLSTPRLRVSRTPRAYDHLLAGSSLDYLPELSATTPAEDSDVNDRDDDQESTPKITPKATLLDPTETPTAQLRALLARTSGASKSTLMPLSPLQSSDHESDFEPPNAPSQITVSSAKENLKNIFSHAMRDPGNTPQKSKIRPRRNSIDVSEVEASPRVQRQRAQNRTNRKSLSDEEIDPAKSSEASFRSSQAATFDHLRERLANSHTRPKDTHPSDSMYQHFIPDDNHDDTPTFLRDTHINTTTPPVAISTPQQSLRMSVDSHFQSQSNLLDQDSEMQRAFEGFDSYDPEVSGPRQVASPETRNRSSPRQTSSLQSFSKGALRADASGQSRERDQERNRPGTPGGAHTLDLSRHSPQLRFPRSGSPAVGTSSSGNLSRQPSNASLRDENSSKGSSFGSQADYRERITELERERNIEREREWNKPRPSLSRPVSSLGISERSRTRSLIRADSPSLASARGEPKTPGTERGESPTHRGHIGNGSRVGNGSTPSARPASPSPFTRPSLSPLSSGQEHTRRSVHTLPRSPSPSTSSQQLKGKAKAIDDHSLTSKSSGDSKSLLYPSSSKIRQSLTPGSYLKKRAPLAPIELEKRTPDHKSFSRKSGPSPSPTENRTSGSGIPVRSPKKSEPSTRPSEHLDLPSPTENNRTSGIPIRSPKKSKPTARPSQQPDLPVPTASSQSKPQVATSTSGIHSHFLDVRYAESIDADDLSRERTSTLSTVPVSLETPEYTPPRSPSPSHSRNGQIDHNGSSQRQNMKPIASPKQMAKMPNPTFLEKLSPPPSPPTQSPKRDSHPESVSFLATPPRRPSFNASKLEFQTPSPPKNMPELPGPPTSSEEGTDSGPDPLLGYLNLTAMKTPRPPGAWATPAASRIIAGVSISEGDSTQEEVQGRPRTLIRELDTNLTAAKTPRPPGAWASTPAPPPPRQLSSEDPSLSGDTEPEYESGLATPVASFSRGSLLPSQTPAPPGAWAATPVARKSILKVRFDAGEGSSAATHSTTRDALEDSTNAPTQTALPQSGASPRTRTPQPITPISPASRRAASQKSPGIRVLDAFGREVKKDGAKPKAANTPKSKSGIRVLDAMGREIESVEEPSQMSTGDVSGPSVPLKHDEALMRVRQGLADLADGLDEMDKLERDNQVDYSRLRELQEASTVARTARVQVSAAIASNTADISRKLEPLRASMKNSRFFSSSTTNRRQTSWMFFSVLVLQLIIFFVLYRIVSTLAQELFITTYYSPFYPDLYLYPSRPDTIHRSMNETLGASWIHQIVEALRTRPSASYGEDIPLNPTAIVDWCIGRLESWGTSAGMETFKDDGRQGSISVVLGGKVVVVDVDFSIDAVDPDKPRITVSSVKTSYAITSSDGTTSNSGGSASLDGFLRDSIANFCDEVQKPEDIRNLDKAARLGVTVTEQLQYLVMLDKLAARRDDGGLRWFTGLDTLCPILEAFATSEAEVVASSLSVAKAPLDIFLLRSHALPLPLLISPSVSFLVHLSPQAYIALLKMSETPSASWDISLSSLRTQLFSIQKGLALATLSLTIAHTGQIYPATMSMPTFTARPTFPLASQGVDLEHVFPQTQDPSTAMLVSADLDASKQYTWILDFTNGGKTPGIVMSQSRMREIELIVNPLGGIDTMEPVSMVSFGTGSWVDLLFNPGTSASPERYTALYISPSSVHPPLQLRLRAPEEPGFRLEKVPVHNMKEVWGILEVVREQCWLNEILSGCQWTAEGFGTSTNEQLNEADATEEELKAVLDGNLPPRKIPVNIFLPSQNIVTDALFQTPDIDAISIPQLPPRRPRIVMTSPERLPISGLVDITIAYDESRPRGVAIEVSGAMSSDIQIDILEEICRRGGTLGLSGRVWSKAS